MIVVGGRAARVMGRLRWLGRGGELGGVLAVVVALRRYIFLIVVLLLYVRWRDMFLLVSRWPYFLAVILACLDNTLDGAGALGWRR